MLTLEVPCSNYLQHDNDDKLEGRWVWLTPQSYSFCVQGADGEADERPLITNANMMSVLVYVYSLWWWTNHLSPTFDISYIVIKLISSCSDHDAPSTKPSFSTKTPDPNKMAYLSMVLIHQWTCTVSNAAPEWKYMQYSYRASLAKIILTKSNSTYLMEIWVLNTLVLWLWWYHDNIYNETTSCVFHINMCQAVLHVLL